MTSKNYADLKSALEGIDGVTLAAYCEEEKLFLIYVDEHKIESPEEIEKVIGQLDPSNKTKILTNMHFAEIINSCSQFPQPSEFEIK